MVHDVLSEFGAGDGEWYFLCRDDGGAKPHALKRSFDGPASGKQSLQERALRGDGVEQERTGLGSRDRMNQGQCISGTVSEQGADMTRGPAVADQHDGAIGCKDA
jgi:hypothetical protein